MARRQTMVSQFMQEPISYGGIIVPRHVAMHHIELTVETQFAGQGLSHQQLSEKINQAQFHLLAHSEDPDRLERSIRGPDAEEIIRKEIREMEERKKSRSSSTKVEIQGLRE